MIPPYAPIHAARGNTRTAKGWIQEAAKRMLMNNLDPGVAEKPEELIVYGGRGKAARNWECYHTIVETLDRLEGENRVAFRYAKGENPNGSARNIAGILSEKRNVLGLMPHPERVVDDVLGGTDGRNLFQSLIESLS